MALPQERLNEIAFQRLLLKFREEGLKLDPVNVKRDIHNIAKLIGITVVEAAECAKVFYRILYEETIKKLDTIIEKADKV